MMRERRGGAMDGLEVMETTATDGLKRAAEQEGRGRRRRGHLDGLN